MIDSNRRFTPEFQAFTRLTLVSQLKNKKEFSIENRKTMSFDEFEKAITEKKVKNSSLARTVSDFHLNHHRVNASNNGNETENKTYDIVTLAFELGLVDKDNVLV